MRVYCWRCKNCGFTFETTYRDAHDLDGSVLGIHVDAPDSNKMGSCICANPDIVRDYKAESVGANLGDLKRERESGFDPRLFLPTTKEFSEQAAAAGDPNPEQAGKRKMDKWMEDHRPSEGNKKPIDPRKL